MADWAPDLRAMNATNGRPTAPARGWVEPKLDGWRARLATGPDGTYRIRSRQDRPLQTGALNQVAARLPAGVLLDGELIAGHGRIVDFADLPAALAGRTTLTYAVFDLLAVGGLPLVDEPIETRRERLEALITPGPGIIIVPRWAGSELDDVYTACCEQGLEGVVWKAACSRYLPGQRSRSWRKIKAPGWQAQRRTDWHHHR